MRRIVYLCSLLVVLLGVACATDEESYGSQMLSASDLWSMVRGGTVAVKGDIVLRGHISANDIVGEFQRSFIFSDQTGGVEVKVDVDDIDNLLPLGSAVTIRCAGLYLGREGSTVTLGAKPTNVYSVDRIAEDMLFNYVARREDAASITVARMAVAEIDPLDMFRYVMVEGVEVVEEERGLPWCDKDESGEYITTLRHFTDGRDTLAIVTAPTAYYCHERVPQGRVACIGIVDIYNEKVALRLSNHQIYRM